MVEFEISEEENDGGSIKSLIASNTYTTMALGTKRIYVWLQTSRIYWGFGIQCYLVPSFYILENFGIILWLVMNEKTEIWFIMEEI